MTGVGRATLRRLGRVGPGEVLALAMAAVVFGFLGWDAALWDARLQLLLHLLAAAAVAGLIGVGLAGGALPRTALYVPILALLVAFAVATLNAQNLGLAIRALAAILATAAMLPIALLALRRRPGWTALVVILPVVALAAGTLLVAIGRRVEWYLAGGPGLLPPLRLVGEGTPFGSVAVPPFILMAALPLTLLAPDPRTRRWLQLALLVVGIPLTVLSGSRSAWLAAGVALGVLVLPWLRAVRLPRRWTPRSLAVAAAVIAATALAVGIVAPRATAVTSLVYRSHLWRDTIAAWSGDPLTGIGPGTMPYARQAAAPPLSFPVQQPHSHNLPLGVLGDAGIVGVAAAATLVVAFVLLAGPWRAHSLAGRSAFAVLAGFAVAGLFEDLTFLPNFNLLVVLLAALALTDAGAVSWRPFPRGRRGLATLAPLATAAAAALLLAGVLVGDAAAVAYRFGTDSALRGDWTVSRDWFVRSVQLDPWHPAGAKALAVAADAAGNAALARRAAERAVALNPGDSHSWTNLALLCRADGDRECALHAADRAVATASPFEDELVNAAYLFEAAGWSEAADEAYRLSLLTNQLTGVASDWPRDLDLERRELGELGPLQAELNLLIGRRTMGDPIDPADYEQPIVRALAAGMTGDRSVAHGALEEAVAADPQGVLTWDVAALLRRHWGEDASRALAVGAVVRGAPLPDEPPGVPRLTFDIGAFRAYPRDALVSSAVRLLPAAPWPWLLEPLLGD